MEGSAYNGTGWVSALESEIRDKVDLGLCFMTNFSGIIIYLSPSNIFTRSFFISMSIVR